MNVTNFLGYDGINLWDEQLAPVYSHDTEAALKKHLHGLDTEVRFNKESLTALPLSVTKNYPMLDYE